MGKKFYLVYMKCLTRFRRNTSISLCICDKLNVMGLFMSPFYIVSNLSWLSHYTTIRHCIRKTSNDIISSTWILPSCVFEVLSPCSMNAFLVPFSALMHSAFEWITSTPLFTLVEPVINKLDDGNKVSLSPSLLAFSSRLRALYLCCLTLFFRRRTSVSIELLSHRLAIIV